MILSMSLQVMFSSTGTSTEKREVPLMWGSRSGRLWCEGRIKPVFLLGDNVGTPLQLRDIVGLSTLEGK